MDIPAGVHKITPDATTELLEKMSKLFTGEEQKELLKLQKKLLQVQEEMLKIQRMKDRQINEAKKSGLDGEEIIPLIRDITTLEHSHIEKSVSAMEEASSTLQNYVEKEEIEQLDKKQLDALQTISNTTKQDFEATKKERKRLVETETAQKMAKTADKVSTSLIDNLMGPLKLVTKPLEQMMGVDFVSGIKGVGSKVGGALASPFRRRDKEESLLSPGTEEDETKEFLEQKVRPTKRDLLQAGILGSSAVYLADTLTGEGEEGAVSEGGIFNRILDSMFGGLTQGGLMTAVKGVGAKLLAGAPILALAGGVLWGAIDAIIAVGKAEDWGVSKVSAGLAGFLAGSGEGGIMDALKGFGKWALIGAGFGIIGGPPGMIAGALVGGAIGGILGFIGGKRLAEAFDAIGNWFSSMFSLDAIRDTFSDEEASFSQRLIAGIGVGLHATWGSILSGLGEVWDGIKQRASNIQEIWGDEETTFWQRIVRIGREVIVGIAEIPINFVRGVVDNLKTLAGTLFGEDQINQVVDLVKDRAKELFDHVFSPIVDGFMSVFEGLKTRWQNITDIAGDEEATFWEKVGGIGKQILLGIIEIPLNFIGGWLESALGDRWTNIKDIAGDDEASMWEKITGIGRELLGGVIDFTWGFFSNWIVGLKDDILGVFGEEAQEKWETMKQGVKDWIGMIFDPILQGFTGMLSGWKTRFTNIRNILGDEETSLWDKVTGVGKELLVGIVETPYNYVKGYITTLFENEKFQSVIDTVSGFITDARETLTGVFTSVRDGVLGFLGRLIPDWLKPGARGEPEEGDAQQVGTFISNMFSSIRENIFGFVGNLIPDWLKPGGKGMPGMGITEDVGSFVSTVFSSIGDSVKDFATGLLPWNWGKGKGEATEQPPENFDMPEEADSGVTWWNPLTWGRKVDDAVIMKDGEIITPHPDDHIIATKDTPQIIDSKESQQMSREINHEYFSKIDMEESNRKFDTMIVLLGQMVEAIKSQEPMGVLQNVSASAYSFDKLRMGN